jgi:AcrR family transcriptional regulator
VGTRSQVLSTALELFSTQGYEGTSLRQIAERLGMTKAAVYYHFQAKEHLVLELTRPFIDGLAELISQARVDPRKPDVRRRHAEMMDGYLDLLLTHHQVVNLLARDPGTQLHPDIGQRVRVLIGALESELVGTDASDDDRARVACALAALSSVAAMPPALAASSRPTVLAAATAALYSAARVPRAKRE